MDHDYAQLNTNLKQTIDDIQTVADPSGYSSGAYSAWQNKVKSWPDMTSHLSDQLSAQRKEYQELAEAIDKKLEIQTESASLQMLRKSAESFVEKVKPQVADVLKRPSNRMAGLSALEDKISPDFAQISDAMDEISKEFSQDRKSRRAEVRQLDAQIKAMQIGHHPSTEFIRNNIQKVEKQIADIDRQYAEINHTLKPTLDHVSTATHSDLRLAWQEGVRQVENWKSDTDAWSSDLSRRREDYQRLADNLREIAKNAGLDDSLGNRTNVKDTPKVQYDSWADDFNAIKARDTERIRTFNKIQGSIKDINNKYNAYKNNSILPVKDDFTIHCANIKEFRDKVEKEIVKIQDDYAKMNLDLRPKIDNLNVIPDQDGGSEKLKRKADFHSNMLSNQLEGHKHLAQTLENLSKDIEKQVINQIKEDYNDRADYSPKLNNWIIKAKNGLAVRSLEYLQTITNDIEEAKYHVDRDLSDIDSADSINPDQTGEWSKLLSEQREDYQTFKENLENLRQEVRYQTREKQLDNLRTAKESLAVNWDNLISEFNEITPKDLDELNIEFNKTFNNIKANIDADISSSTNQETWLNKLDEQKTSCTDLKNDFEELFTHARQHIDNRPLNNSNFIYQHEISLEA